MALAGLLALACNATVPIHLAFDLSEALGPIHCGEAHSLEWHALATLIGHDVGDAHGGDHHGHHHDSKCPVIAAFGALTGLAPAATPTPVQPATVVIADLPALTADRPTIAPTLSYRSRAPPLV